MKSNNINNVCFYNISDECSVIEKKSRDVQPCIFPFQYLGQTFNNCTILKDPENKPWCSTKVDEDGTHVTSGGFWGHCGQDCVEKDLIELKSELSAEEGNFDVFFYSFILFYPLDNRLL